MRGYWTKQRMSRFSDLPRTALCGGHALVCAFFSFHFSHFTPFSLLHSFFLTATTLILIQLNRLGVDHSLLCPCFQEDVGWHIKEVVTEDIFFFLCFQMLFLDYYCACVQEKQKQRKTEEEKHKHLSVYYSLSLSTSTHTVLSFSQLSCLPN